MKKKSYDKVHGKIMLDVYRIGRDCVIYSYKGAYHRDDGKPAVINDSPGRQEWYVNGERHREDGPAVVDANRDVFYYINGEIVDPPEYNNWAENNEKQIEKEYKKQKD